jgi:virginiamycin B lyase
MRFVRRIGQLTKLAIIAVSSIAIIPPLLPAQRAGASSLITEYALSASPTQARGIATGSDGALWFADSDANSIGRVTTGGVISYYSLPTSDAVPTYIAAGSDGALWFTESSADAIGRITTSGTITEYTLPTADAAPWGITAGPDGALWFTEEANNAIGRITTSGTISEYGLPNTVSTPYAITTGPDGALWFTESGDTNIGRITTSGTITGYSVSSTGVSVYGITTGSDGALWFSEQGQPDGSGNYENIGRITTSGTVTFYGLPANAAPVGIAAGPDGALWFGDNNSSGSSIGRITTSGTITEFALSTSANPWGITLGPDSAVWFTEDGVNNIGRIVDLPAAPSSLTIPSPTQNAVLSWAASAGASSYVVYRNGSSIATTSATTYTDTTSSEGTNDYYVKAVNYGGSSPASSTVSAVVDRTAPSIGSLSVSSLVIVGSASVTISATASDPLSGVAGGEFYVDTDPGQGNGTAMTFASGQISKTTSFSLTPGVHTIFVRAKDNAGNWSTVLSQVVTYL